MRSPVNSVGGGNIAGTREIWRRSSSKKKEKYIYQKGLRKWWTSLTK